MAISDSNLSRPPINGGSSVGAATVPADAFVLPASGLLGGVAPDVPVDALTPSECAIARALMRCVARWGVNKTTIEDIAREAGVSRATVYRQFPGGKSAILSVAWSLDMAELVSLVAEQVRDADDLETALAGGLRCAAAYLGEHPALTFMRSHEPAEFEQLVAFERMDLILAAASASMAPLLERFVSSVEASDTAMWCARLLVSYLSDPADYLDISTESGSSQLIRMFVLPGIRSGNTERGEIDLTNQPPSTKSPAAQDLTTNNRSGLDNGDPSNIGDHNVHS